MRAFGEALQRARPAHAGDETPAVSFRGVDKTFLARGESTAVLSDFNLSVRPGEFLAIVGPSGGGKSTVLNLLAGLEAPTRGEIFCHGAKVEAINDGVGYLTQHDSLLPWLTVEQNVAIPLEIRSVARAERAARVGEMIANVGLSGFEKRYPSQLSGGMRKRAMLARTLIYDPQTLLMDEPFGPLDAQLKLILQDDLMRLWSESRKTVLFVTHDIHEAITLADRVIVLSRRPSRIKCEEHIDIARPRRVHEVQFAPRFEEHYRRLWNAIDTDGLRR